MLNIEIKPTADQVFAISKLLEQVFNLYPAITYSQKATRSIAYDLEEKFSAKCKEIVKKSSLFEANKTYKITLKYHEALCLQRIINNLLTTVIAVKPANDLRTIHDYLHQKLV